jgi:hypothetical protein
MIIIHGMKTLPRLVGVALSERIPVMPAVVVTGAFHRPQAEFSDGANDGKFGKPRQEIFVLQRAVRNLLLFLKGRRIGIEIKRADAPKMTPSISSALEGLELHRVLVVYPGSVRYMLRPKVEAMSLAQCVAELA